MATWTPAAPVVSYLGADNLGRTAAGTLTIAGVSFGARDNTPSSRIDAAVCGTAAWTSGSSVNCYSTSSPSELSTGVTVGGLAGTRLPGFTFDGTGRLLTLWTITHVPACL